MQTPPDSDGSNGVHNAAQRRRKAHKKSRRGCGNCKMRRVKCDETKPSCKKCGEFGVSCNYGPLSSTSAGELIISFRGATNIEPVQRPPVSMRESMRSMINHSLQTYSNQADTWMPVYQLRMQDMEVMDRFWSRTILTMGTDVTRDMYQQESYRLGSMHSFLVHLSMALTMMHDRELSTDVYAPPSAAELFHMGQGISLYNARLSQPENCSPSERDAIWIGSTILGVAMMASIEARTPEDAWPLKPRGASEPNWIAIQDGKKEVWRVTDPMREDSSLHKLSEVVLDTFMTKEPKRGELSNLPKELIEILGLSDPSTWHSNPRFGAANIISRLMPHEYNGSTVLKYVTFFTQMDPEFRVLLEEKDPGALILFAYWYAKVSKRQQWWTWRRSVLECQAICMYLDQNHGDLPHIKEILHFPRSMCGDALRPRAGLPSPPSLADVHG